MAQLDEALSYKFDSRLCHWHNPSGRNMGLALT